MSASRSPELSDIHPGPTTVAETLQVSTEPATISIGTTAGAVGSDSHSTIPAVGASISVPEPSAAGIGGVERSSTALLNLASNSLSLTEILNAQQQALEQFQCQLQLAQQTEAINQRLDAIERTLNSLIQQKAQEDAEKHQKAQQEQAVAEQQAAAVVEQQVDRLTVRDASLSHTRNTVSFPFRALHFDLPSRWHLLQMTCLIPRRRENYRGSSV